MIDKIRDIDSNVITILFILLKQINNINVIQYQIGIKLEK
jgi:hypothetical protein